MTAKDWKEFIIYGLGGLVLFITTGIASAVDILAYIDGRTALYTYYSKRSGYNELGIFFTLILVLLSIIGLISLVFYSWRTNQRFSMLKDGNDH